MSVMLSRRCSARPRASASTVTAPARRIRGTSAVISTIVEATPIRDGPPSRYTSTLSPSWSRASVTVERRRLPGDVGARHRHRPGQRRAARWRPGAAASGSPTVPRASPRSHDSDGACCTTIVSPPGQNASISRRAESETNGDQAVDRVPRTDQDRQRHVPAAALGGEQIGDRGRVEGVGARCRTRCRSAARPAGRSARPWPPPTRPRRAPVGRRSRIRSSRR